MTLTRVDLRARRRESDACKAGAAVLLGVPVNRGMLQTVTSGTEHTATTSASFAMFLAAQQGDTHAVAAWLDEGGGI